MTRNPSVLFLRADYAACSYYRAVVPAKGLADKGWRVSVDDNTRQVLDFDVIVFQRQADPIHIQILMQLRDLGKKVVYDIDDNMHRLRADNPTWYRTPPEHREMGMEVILECMRWSHAVTVSTEPLADFYRQYNRNIVVLPNCVDRATLDWRSRNGSSPAQVPPIAEESAGAGESSAVDKRLTVGWQGGWSHTEDLQTIQGAINRLSRRKDFEFVLAGFEPPGVFREATYRPWAPFDPETLPHYSLFEDFDVGLCPLKDHIFNECKSDIKFVEYGTLGIPTVASDVEAYRTIRHGETGMLARTRKEWESCIEGLLDDESLRRRLGEAAREYVRSERVMQDNAWRWEEVYANL